MTAIVAGVSPLHEQSSCFRFNALFFVILFSFSSHQLCRALHGLKLLGALVGVEFDQTG